MVRRAHHVAEAVDEVGLRRGVQRLDLRARVRGVDAQLWFCMGCVVVCRGWWSVEWDWMCGGRAGRLLLRVGSVMVVRGGQWDG